MLSAPLISEDWLVIAIWYIFNKKIKKDKCLYYINAYYVLSLQPRVLKFRYEKDFVASFASFYVVGV